MRAISRHPIPMAPLHARPATREETRRRRLRQRTWHRNGANDRSRPQHQDVFGCIPSGSRYRPARLCSARLGPPVRSRWWRPPPRSISERFRQRQISRRSILTAISTSATSLASRNQGRDVESARLRRTERGPAGGTGLISRGHCHRARHRRRAGLIPRGNSRGPVFKRIAIAAIVRSERAPAGA